MKAGQRGPFGRMSDARAGEPRQGSWGQGQMTPERERRHVDLGQTVHLVFASRCARWLEKRIAHISDIRNNSADGPGVQEASEEKQVL